VLFRQIVFSVREKKTMTSSYKSIILAQRPTDNIVPGETFKVKQEGPVPSSGALKDGEVLFRTNYLSIDPGMRDWLNDDRSYMPPVGIGEVMRGFAAGIVVASKNDKLPEGSYATGLVGWTEYKVCHDGELQIVDIPTGGKLVNALSVFGE
jgi:NADPH-dependent curcumin reductase CurA